jgi:hypothetical protein
MAEILIPATLGGIGLSLAANCITTLTTSANGIYTLIGNISSSGIIPDITRFLNESDIEDQIRTLEFLLKEIDIHKNPTRTLSASLASLQECVSKIEEILHDVKTRMEYNKSLWFLVSIRSYGFSDIVQRLKTLKMTLDNRQNKLIDILKINVFLTPMTESKYMEMTNKSEKETSVILNPITEEKQKKL